MTGKVELREVRPDDLPILFEHQQEPEANLMAAFPPRDRDDFMAHWTKVLADPTGTTRAILLDGAVAGNVVSWGPPEGREVGYWIGREHWGKGVATKALTAFLLESESTRPLWAHVAAHNAGSIRVLEKCGFTLERRERGASIRGSGEVDELVMKLEA
jgi:RimJ/RimL family protein N-acetyltransferase